MSLLLLFSQPGAPPPTSITITFPVGVTVTAGYPNGPETSAAVGATIDPAVSLQSSTVDETLRLGATASVA